MAQAIIITTTIIMMILHRAISVRTFAKSLFGVRQSDG